MNFITENWVELLIGIMAFAKVITNLTATNGTNIAPTVYQNFLELNIFFKISIIYI